MSVTLSDDQARMALKALMDARDHLDLVLQKRGLAAASRMALESRAIRYNELEIDIWSELKGGQDGTGDAGAAGDGVETGVH